MCHRRIKQYYKDTMKFKDDEKKLDEYKSQLESIKQIEAKVKDSEVRIKQAGDQHDMTTIHTITQQLHDICTPIKQILDTIPSELAVEQKNEQHAQDTDRMSDDTPTSSSSSSSFSFPDSVTRSVLATRTHQQAFAHTHYRDTQHNIYPTAQKRRKHRS